MLLFGHDGYGNGAGKQATTSSAESSTEVVKSQRPRLLLVMSFCAISGEAPQEPVVSAKSGFFYERRLILKYINENGTDPITGDKLEESDLIAVKPCM